jgi:hypothetical protein
MAGILDNKSRIMDTIITQQGRKNIAEGEQLNISFVGFTDGNTFYQADAVSGSDDTSYRIFLEASSLLQDNVTFEKDKSGYPVPYYDSTVGTVNGQILSASSTTGNLTYVTASSQVLGLSEGIISSSINHFKNLGLIGTLDRFSDADEFRISQESLTYTLTEELRSRNNIPSTTNFYSLDKFHQDKKLSHVPNYDFMPPINKENYSSREEMLAAESIDPYWNENQRSITSYDQILNSVQSLESFDIDFVESSRENNIAIQMFESTDDPANAFNKLDIIDFGNFITDDARPDKRVFFVGKVIDKGYQAYVNIFTVILE